MLRFMVPLKSRPACFDRSQHERKFLNLIKFLPVRPERRRRVNEDFSAESLHAACPRAITSAEFFEPKPMQLHRATSTWREIARLAM
jgi:hypothetical protein